MKNNFQLNNLLGEEEETDLFSTVVLTTLIVIMVGIFAFICFFQLCSVNGQSMTNTIQNGDNILITRYDAKYKTGDIIVLDVEHNDKKIRLIKRVIATENEVIKFSCVNDIVYLYKKQGGEFVKVEETYIKEPMQAKHFSNSLYKYEEEITVPKNSVFFLGDNRNDSADSRIYGTSETSKILGKMVKKLKKGSFAESIVKLIFNAHELDEEKEHKIYPLFPH